MEYRTPGIISICTLFFIVLGFISSGPCFITSMFTFSDCGDPAKEAITVTYFDMLPKPAVVPGVLNVTISGNVSEILGNDVTLNVTMQKFLLNRWTKIPCALNVGSCIYDNPCEFVQVFADRGKCPAALEENGLPCTCPFQPDHLDMPYSLFNITTIPASFQWLVTGDFRVRVEMTRNKTLIGCFTSTVSFKRSDHSTGGFLFG